MELNEMSITELKAALFDIDQQIKERQQAYNQVAQKLQEEANKESKKGEKKEDKEDT